MLASAVNFFFFHYDQVVACHWNQHQQTTPTTTTTPIKMQIKATIIALTAREAMTMLERQITTLIIMMITATNNDYTKNKTTRHP